MRRLNFFKTFIFVRIGVRKPSTTEFPPGDLHELLEKPINTEHKHYTEFSRLAERLFDH